MSNHPDTCLLDDHDGWIVCHHGRRWRDSEGEVCLPCLYGNCDTEELFTCCCIVGKVPGIVITTVCPLHNPFTGTEVRQPVEFTGLYEMFGEKEA